MAVQGLGVVLDVDLPLRLFLWKAPCELDMYWYNAYARLDTVLSYAGHFKKNMNSITRPCRDA